MARFEQYRIGLSCSALISQLLARATTIHQLQTLDYELLRNVHLYSVHLHPTATAFHVATLTGGFDPIKLCIILKLSSFK